MAKKAIGRVVRLGVSAALLGFLAWRMDWNQVRDAFINLRVELWLLALGVYLLSQVTSALRWQLLSRPLGFERPFRQYVGFYFIGMFFNMLLPTAVGGDVVRAWYLHGGSGSRLPALLSVFVDRASGLMVLLSLACTAVMLCPLTLPAWIPLSVWATAAAAVAALAVIGTVDKWGRWTAGIRAGKLVSHVRARAFHSSQALRLYRHHPGLLLTTTLLSLVVQAGNVVIVWLVGLSIDAPVPAAYYWIVVPMVSLLTMLPISVNGMGVREGGMVLLLAPVGVGAGTATILAFLWFLTYTAGSLFGVAFYLFGRYPRFEVQTDDGFVGDYSDQGRAGEPAPPAPETDAGPGPLGAGLRVDLRG